MSHVCPPCARLQGFWGELMGRFHWSKMWDKEGFHK